MIEAIIIDDEMHCRKTLSILLKEYCPDVQVIEQCDSGEAGADATKTTQASHIVNLNEISKYIKGEGGYLVMSDG